MFWGKIFSLLISILVAPVFYFQQVVWLFCIQSVFVVTPVRIGRPVSDSSVFWEPVDEFYSSNMDLAVCVA